MNLILLLSLLTSISILIAYLIRVNQAVEQLPQINFPTVNSPLPKISVIIPAFNEEDNIEDCVNLVLTSTDLSAAQLEIWVVDDQSGDRTLEILKTRFVDPRLHILVGSPRPTDQIWIGKNWACQQAANQASGEFLLFIDADVRLMPHTISAVVQTAVVEQLDFLTCIPAVVCGSLIEWLVQPLMFINLMVAFNAKTVKDPTTKTTYALGAFLLFRTSAYKAVGMHQAVSGYLAEDVAFARKLKHNGFKLQHVLGANLASLRMYRNWQSLWEGWTKVLYVGTQRSVLLILLLVWVMLLIYTLPWMAFGISIVQSLIDFTYFTPLQFIQIGLAGFAILLQCRVRQQAASVLGTSMKYWWLQGIGGALIAVLAISSLIKTKTGWGWTWRGRPLQSTKD